jgi:transcriptional regulator with XRE-family HTH domain
MLETTNRFGPRLRWWRERRGWSQLDLALAADVSQRHVSFVESGRTAPSREMVLRLATALDVPLRQQNALLVAAGYAPAWRERSLAEPELTKVNSALGFILDQQEPYPAVVVDRRWNLLRANTGAVRLTEFLADDPPAPAADPVNLADALMAPDGLRRSIVNWPEVAGYFLRTVQADAIADGTAETADLLERLLAYPDVAALAHALPPEDPTAPVLLMRFRKRDTALALFTTIATLGTPLDVTVQELRIESFFPADDATAGVFRGWAAPVAEYAPRH